MKYTAKKYQRFCTDFILEHPVAAIFLDMGLGKTAISLDAVRQLKEKGEISHVLVVAPKRVAESTWPAEIQKFDEFKDLTFALASGTAAQRKAALLEKADITIIGRDNLVWLESKSGVPFYWDMMILDELSSYKAGAKTKRFKSLLKMRPYVKRIIGLTGTPGGSLLDLHGEFRVLDMGERLGRYRSQYINRFFLPDKRNANIVFTYKLKEGAEEEIYRLISDITVSMKSVDYLDMPDKVVGNTVVELSTKERQAYDRLRKDMVLELGDSEIDAMNAAVLSNKLTQMANGCVYDSEGNTIAIHDRKLDALEDLIEAANGEPVLVSIWYKADRDRIRERFPQAREIKTAEDIIDWNEGRVTIGIAHPQQVGMGVNLQSQHILIFYSTPWSLELYQQTCARLYRQGQKSRTVIIQHIITKDTIDENILAALERKDTTQSALIDAVKANLEVGVSEEHRQRTGSV